VRAAVRAGSPHVVFISSVGADRIPVVSAARSRHVRLLGQKLAAEHVIEASGLPFTTLRATAVPRLRVGELPSPGEVARRARPPDPVPAGRRGRRRRQDDRALALGRPPAWSRDGWSALLPLADLVRDHLRATGRRRLLLPLRQPGQAARAFREGGNLTHSPAVGLRTWESYVEERTRR
jgi:uncharacterized protein YbjT (DUF2867 family)